MSLWPIKVRYKELVEREATFLVDYREFEEWSGVNLHDATDDQIIEFLDAGAEFGYTSYDEQVVSRGVDG